MSALPPLARQLHDGVLQSLAVARIRLGRALALEGPLPREVGVELGLLLEREIAEVRRLVAECADEPSPPRSGPAADGPFPPDGPPSPRPGPAAGPHPPYPGLPAALAAVAAELQSATGIRVHLRVTGPAGSWPGGWRGNDLVAYRIVREALHNTARHSGARRAWVSVAAAPERLRCAVYDDGHGFPPPGSPAPARPHFGLAGMYAQAREAGGHLAVRSRRGSTRVTLALPPCAEGTPVREVDGGPGREPGAGRARGPGDALVRRPWDASVHDPGAASVREPGGASVPEPRPRPGDGGSGGAPQAGVVSARSRDGLLPEGEAAR